jgi:hypothetical protein
MIKAIGMALDLLDKKSEDIELGPNGTSLDLLRAVYRSTAQPLGVRIRAAVAALPHEVPKLIATAVINEGSFAELLERRLQHLKAINEGKVIEATPSTAVVEVKPPAPRVADKRFRRL